MENNNNIRKIESSNIPIKTSYNSSSEGHQEISKSINSKRYSYSTNKDSVKSQSFSSVKNDLYYNTNELKRLYEKKQKELSSIYKQYLEINDCCKQKYDVLLDNKMKYDSLKKNNNNMKLLVLKLMKIKDS